MATPYPGFRQHLREQLMRDAVDRKIEERRNADPDASKLPRKESQRLADAGLGGEIDENRTISR